MAINNEVVAYTGTQQLPWQTVGIIDAAAGNADAALGVSERDFATANALANCVSIAVDQDISSAEIRAIFATDDEDAIFDIWGMRKGGLYMARICTVTAKAGQQYANADGSLVYADTLSLTNALWAATVASIIPGANHMARVILDMWSWKTLLFHGHTTFDENVIIQMAGTS